MSGYRLAESGEGIALSGGNLTFVVVVAAIALVALVFAFVLRKEVLAADQGTENMQRIGVAVQEGASAYLTRQFKTLAVFAALAFALLFVLPGDASIRIGRSVFFLLGAGFSATIGYLGMWLAVRANVRVAAAARVGNRDAAMKVAFRTGGFVGMSTVGLGCSAPRWS
jgi:K(+)-stimulated pyrophosphate-energized sodium pump